MVNIKILGPGCANCRKLEAIARDAAAAAHVQAEFVKVTDIQQIMHYDLPISQILRPTRSRAT
mgnify:CR=1 FL=1